MYLVCFHSYEIQEEAKLVYDDEVRRAFSFGKVLPGRGCSGGADKVLDLEQGDGYTSVFTRKAIITSLHIC